MSKQIKVSNGFRRQLRKELAGWGDDGTVSRQQADAIGGRYDLANLPRESANIFLMAVCVIGAVLIAAGVISFVAFHWEAMGQWTKVSLLMAALLGAELVGFYLRDASQSRPILGHGFLVMGALIFGANIGLMTQIFHVQSNFHTGFGAWAVGTLVMAWALRSMPIGVISVVTSVIWFVGWIDQHQGDFYYYPYVLVAGLATLAYARRSVFLFTLVAGALVFSVSLIGGMDGDQFWIWTAATFCVGHMLVAWGFVSGSAGRLAGTERLAIVSAVIGTAVLILPSFILSFQEAAEELAPVLSDVDNWMWAYPTGTALLAGLALWGIGGSAALRRQNQWPVLLAVWVGSALTVAMLCLSLADERSYAIVTVLANMVLVVMASGLSWGGVLMLDRRVFWLGTVLAAIVVASRFFEYQTGLLIKSAAFLLCGVLVLFVGLRFETHLSKTGGSS